MFSDIDALWQNFKTALCEIQNLYFSMFANNAMLVYAISYTWKSMYLDIIMIIQISKYTSSK